jgi:hypothetical protein
MSQANNLSAVIAHLLGLQTSGSSWQGWPARIAAAFMLLESIHSSPLKLTQRSGRKVRTRRLLTVPNSSAASSQRSKWSRREVTPATGKPNDYHQAAPRFIWRFYK